LNTVCRIYKLYMKWRKNWDELCSRCGLCCYARSISKTGKLIIDYNAPCEHFDKKTCLCRVFENRFKKCNHCGKVNLYCVLFNPTLPTNCAYAKTFRVWLADDKADN